MAVTRFVRNYQDQSTDEGFQFEFFCDCCDTGYQTDFTPTDFNTVGDVLDAAGNLFGGVISTIADLGQRARSAKWEKEHDVAFKKAVAEIQKYFHQCTRCSGWVDDACWNQAKQSCKNCLEEESPETQEENTVQLTTCPSCDTEVSATAKFCPECGDPIRRTKTCPSCGVEASGKFCAECGEKL